MWRTLELPDVLAFSRSERLEAAWAADDDPQRDTWFATLRDTVVAQIRAKASAKGANALDADTSRIPPEFVELAALRLLIAILSRLGPTAGLGGQGGTDPLGLTEDQRTRLTQLEKDLDAVAKGELSVTAPEQPETSATMANTAPAVQLTGTNTRLFTRDTLRGL